MTGQTARRFRLDDRGVIRQGAWADLVLFDAARIGDRATFTEPTLPAAGILGVWVNGVQSFVGGAATPERRGRFLSPVASAA
jgi:N-acyl-D-amino-acid deacylase